MSTHFLSRVLDFASDPRMLYNFVEIGIRAHRLRNITNRSLRHRPDKLLLALTFDVEHDYGKHSHMHDASSVQSFLDQMLQEPCNATFFVEGDLVADHSDTLALLQKKGVEIGLHGYRHELWGPSQWYLADKPLSADEKNRLLEEALEQFEKAGLVRPLAFRAPNLVLDDSAVRLLAEKGFAVDSSLPSHRGVLPVPQLVNVPGRRIVRIPVSVDPVPVLSITGYLPHYRYLVCNICILKQLTGENLLEYVSRIAAVQQALGSIAHLVVLCHSWEFTSPLANLRGFTYCSEGNFAFLRSLMDQLAKNFNVESVSMSKLAQILTQKKSS